MGFAQKAETNILSKIKELEKKSDSIHKEVAVIKTILKNQLSFEEEIKKKNDEINNLKSINEVLQQELNNQEKNKAETQQKIAELENLLKERDFNIALLANGVVYDKYDADRVKSALERFNTMYNPKSKEEYGKLKDLLEKYGEYSKKIDEIINQAKEDRKSKPIEFNKEKWIDKIKQTEYYKKVYPEKSKEGGWYSPYLNDLIDSIEKNGFKKASF